MKKIFLILLILQFNNLVAQKNYMVSYSRESLANNTSFGNYNAISKLIIGDSISYYYHLIGTKDEENGCEIFGLKNLHHSCFYITHTNEYYSVVNTSIFKNNPTYSKSSLKNKIFYLVDTIKILKWDLLDTNFTKMVLKRKCNGALATYNNNDSVLVWFDKKIETPFTAFWYNGLPGLVLEVYDQKRNEHIIATKIIEGNFKIEIPKNNPKISNNEYHQKIKNP